MFLEHYKGWSGRNISIKAERLYILLKVVTLSLIRGLFLC